MMKKQHIYQCWQAVGIVLTFALGLRALLWVARLLNTTLLARAEVPLVSIANLKWILNDHGGVMVAVILELILLWLILLILFMGLISALLTILNGQPASVSGRQFWKALKGIRLQSMGIFLVDLIVLAPLFSIAFRTPLLTAIRIPEFLLDYGTRKWWLLGAGGLIYLVCWSVAVRSLYVWKLMILDGQPVQVAMQHSSQLTQHGRWWQPCRWMCECFIKAGIVSWVVNGLLYGLQAGLMPNNLWLSTACLVLAEMGAVLLCSWVLLQWTRIITMMDEGATQRPALNWWTVVVLVMVTINAGIGSYHYFQPGRLKRPVTISHRGVVDKHGVQNSVSALKRTSRKYHPDYVEMDLHETKDHQFVVIHDDNLETLAGIHKRPGELTLRELKGMSIKENGQRARIPSFDEYLAAAAQVHQKLIVELKTTQYDPGDVARRFNQQYGRLMVKRHYIVHSLDYGVIDQLHRQNPRMTLLYLQAYNFTNPEPNIPGFNNEYSTLNQRFINAAHREQRPVYAWTVNNQGAMRQLINQQVDGIMTDQIPQLQTTIAQVERQQSRARRYWNYLNPVANLPC